MSAAATIQTPAADRGSTQSRGVALAIARTFALDGMRAVPVTVEVDVARGLPEFRVIGVADVVARDARERVRAAIVNCGFEFPSARITANLAPGDVRKEGPGFDLTIACAVLAASGQLPAGALAEVALFGELGLDGDVRACRGALAAALRAGTGKLLLAGQSAREAQLVPGLEVAAVGWLGAAVRVLCGGPSDPLPPAQIEDVASAAPPPLDLRDVYGQRDAVEALVVAAAGGHNVFLSGPPGCGKTMLAQRVAGILPPLSDVQALDVLAIRSLIGQQLPSRLSQAPPFRAPHHSVSMAGLIGGAGTGWVGEVVLAHNGVLFLDELAEFSRPALEALRQPIEDGTVTISRAKHNATYPARFMLIAAANPCPCGWAGVPGRCRCTRSVRDRYARRLSGPLLDRIDLFPRVVPSDAEIEGSVAVTSSARARELVLAARERQAARAQESGVPVNAQLDPRTLARFVRLDERGQRLITRARQRAGLTVRGQHRALRVARTIADLAASERVTSEHVAKALALGAGAGANAVQD